MPELSALEQQFRQLQQTGQLDGLLLVLREELQLSRNDLDAHYMSQPLTTKEATAEVYMLQGRMKCCADLVSKIRTLAGIGKTPKPEK